MPYPLMGFALLIGTISVFNIYVALTVADFTRACWTNFGTVVGHDNQLKKLVLSWVSFLTCLNIQIGKKGLHSGIIFFLWAWLYFYSDKSKIYRWDDLVIFSSVRVAWLVNDQRVKFLAGQATFLAGHCPLTRHYFEPCFYVLFCTDYIHIHL